MPCNEWFPRQPSYVLHWWFFFHLMAALVAAEMASNSTISSSEPCSLHPSDNLNLVLATIHLLTLSVQSVTAKMVYDKVEIAHPVFAAIFQELVVVTSLNVFCLVCLFSTFKITDVRWMDYVMLTYTMGGVFALQFHQTTWLCVTYLRYY